jgi:hypothetical protein
MNTKEQEKVSNIEFLKQIIMTSDTVVVMVFVAKGFEYSLRNGFYRFKTK